MKPEILDFIKTAEWTELVALYSGEEKIPDDALYIFLNRNNREEILNLSHLGIENLKTDHNTPWPEVRRRSLRDLYWLAKYFLHETNPEMSGRPIEECKINEYTHRRLCDFFVKKDNTKSIAEQEGKDWKDRRKERIILYPRGGFKSTIDIADAVQWVLNFPEIRLLFLTAADDLAVGCVDEVKAHFLRRDIEPSLMNMFFPEYSADESELGNEFEYNCPLWSSRKIKRREPTIMASSIGSTLSGFHFEVMKSDDVVSNKNSENEDQCKRVTKNFHINLKMLRPFGYLDLIGTRYAEYDLYGDSLEKNVGNIKEESGPCWQIIRNLDTGLKVLIGRAWQVKPDAKAKLDECSIKHEDLTEKDYDLLFPDVLSYKFLRYEQHKDEISFEGQYNQNPRPPMTTTFDRPLLLRSTVNFQEMPFSGPITHVWDFAFSTQKGRDYTTAASAMWNDKGQCFINDLVRARFKPNDLAQAVVDFALKWRPTLIAVEKAGGSQLLEPAIIEKAKNTKDAYVIALCNKIDWFIPERQKDAKRIRMASLHPWLVNGQMKFANYLPFLSVLYDEFEICLQSHHHDDIPDVLSQLPRYAPRMAVMIEKKELAAWSKADAAYNILFESADCFGRIGGAMPAPQPVVQIVQEEEIKPILQSPEYEPMLGSGVLG